jgi:Family of unknown function (DUF6065)/Sulfotransferase domain
MKLDCYRTHEDAPELVPASAGRAWMDATVSRFAYRCTPLTIASSTGWELLCPSGIKASWNGGKELSDLVIEHEELGANPPHFAQSMFGHGVLTFHPGYLFRTDPEWAVWCRGAPNSPKDGIAALDGLVETDWVPFTFTMNWLFTRPCSVRFEKGEPFCFIVPVPHMQIEAIEPKITSLSDNPELQAEYAVWAASRKDFNERRVSQKLALNEKWQRFYVTGKSPREITAPTTHRTKRRMAEPRGAKPPSESPKAKKRPGAQSPQAPDQVAQNIIWIASYPKSGNTWARVFLHNLLDELSGDAGAAHDINRLNQHTVWEIPGPPFEKVLGKPLGRANHADIARARAEVQRQMANGRAGPFFVKTHLCLGNDHGYPTINLDATLAAIYIVRNPLDVAISYAHHSGQSVDVTIRNMATPGLKSKPFEGKVYEVLGSWNQNVASWMGMTRRPVHLMRYEDMLANPERSFAALAGFLRLKPSAEQLKRAIAKSSFAELRRQEEQHGFKERPAQAAQFFREGRAGQWREVLAQKQIEDICTAHAPIMQRFGYLIPDCGRSIAPARPAALVPAK